MVLSLLQGVSVTAVVMGLYALSLQVWDMAPAAAATLAFVVLVSANAVLILPSRFAQTRGGNLLRDLPVVSWWVLGGTLAALLLITQWSVLAAAFGFAVLPVWQWLAALGLGLAMVGVFQLNKWVLR